MSNNPEIEETEVFPGDKLAVIEEFNRGKGTYELYGDIRSSEIGITRHNMSTRMLTVMKQTPQILVPREGMEAVAEVGSVARRDARVDIFILNGKHIYPTYSGVVHISDISREYTKNIDLALRNGDIIKGRIVNVRNRLNQMSLEGSQYGVIYAYCSRCGGLMEEKQNKLTCPDCGRVERRKTAREYGKVDLT
jgi:exosome complex component CSL4